ncbi:hypothetical protein JTE90_015967 [Oedothorax gibbosus]|uniref:Laminin G domain-containing protein n=1 Tax=Oedothorax gibbosus TaxID=931172 RepID=A0AAV6VSS3_9ARAC|nr:hypothetical protein JTE90_015967 [Oedothorax gibbosus]
MARRGLESAKVHVQICYYFLHLMVIVKKTTTTGNFDIRYQIGLFMSLSSCLITEASSMEFSISKTWDSQPSDHDPIIIKLYPEGDFVVMEMTAPFFNDPPAPEGESGKPFPKLWDYEVVEAFFLGADEKYLEVEFSPYGQHLLLLLSGRKNAIKMCLPVTYSASITDNTWHGVAKIPNSYFPPRVNLFNAYAIHGSGDGRQYEALYPVPTGHFPHPDFHRLEFFRHIEFDKILKTDNSLSEVWLTALQNSGKELSCGEQ